jgi:hypothetical protein
MTLAVEPPEPPELSPERTVEDYDDVDVDAESGEYRREELQSYLDDGAWERAFEEWTDHAELDEAEWQIVLDLGLVGEFDFFWDDFAGRVGYHAPGLPEDWRERELHPDIDSWGTVSGINASLTELGQIVCDVLKDEYIDWDANYDAPDDLPEY